MVVKLTGDDKDEWYAMKKYSKEFLLGHSTGVEEVMWELGMLATLKHQWICNARYAFQDEQHCYLVMDLGLGGDLRYHLKESKTFEEDRVRIYLAQVFLALEYLHSKKVIHRDIKPENVLMDKDGFLKLTDLGISARVVHGACTRSSGTPRYMAPELYTDSHKHSYASDWWSYGVMAHELLTGQLPFESDAFDNATQKVYVRDGELEKDAPHFPTPTLSFHGAPMSKKTSSFSAPKGSKKKPVKVSNECALFVDQLLQKNPDRRLGANSASEIKYHPFFHGFNWSALEAHLLPAPFVPDTTKANVDMGQGDNFERMLMGGENISLPSNFVVPDEDKDKFKNYHFHSVLQSPDGDADVTRDDTRAFSLMLNANKVTSFATTNNRIASFVTGNKIASFVTGNNKIASFVTGNNKIASFVTGNKIGSGGGGRKSSSTSNHRPVYPEEDDPALRPAAPTGT